MPPTIRIGHLTSGHSPGDHRIYHKECLTLSEAGFDVVLVAPTPPTAPPLDGVRLVAVAPPASRWERLYRALPEILRAALDADCQAYHFHDPELIPVGLALKALNRRVVYDVHENLPLQCMSKPWVPTFWRPWSARIAGGLERLAGSSFDGFVAATPEIAERFPAARTVTIQNFPMFQEFQLGKAYPQRAARVIYAGNITPERGVFEMAQALTLVPEALAARLTVAGAFSSPELEASLRTLPSPAVSYVGWQGRAGIQKLMTEARVGLVVLHPTPSYVESYPTKLFEYMAAGLPVIASDFPLFRSIVEGAGCGLLVDPRSPEAIADAITWLLTHEEEAEAMGRRGREAAFERFNWAAEARKLLTFYEQLLADAPVPLASPARLPAP